MSRPSWYPRILTHLRAAGEDSITGVTRALQAGDLGAAHRLTIAGYLMALEDLQIVASKDTPPSKSFRLLEGMNQWPHQFVRQAVEAIGVAPKNRCALSISVLQALLARPIFDVELQVMGYGKPGLHVQEASVDQAERRRALKSIERATGGILEVPRGDPMWKSSYHVGNEEFQRVLLHLLRKQQPEWDAWLPPERDVADDQTRLRVDAQ